MWKLLPGNRASLYYNCKMLYKCSPFTITRQKHLNNSIRDITKILGVSVYCSSIHILYLGAWFIAGVSTSKCVLISCHRIPSDVLHSAECISEMIRKRQM